MAAHHCIQIIQRVVHDLLQFQDGRDIPPATLKSISISIELAYRELVVLDLANELNNKQKEAIDIVRRCISDIRDLQDIYQVSEVRGRSSVLSVYAGGVGRPQYDDPEQALEMLLENRFAFPQISNMMGVSVSTIRRRMSALGLSVRGYYSNLSDSELDEIVRSIQWQYHMCGNQQMHGHLLIMGHRIQQARIRDSQRRIDSSGTALHRLRVLNRRHYSVPSPLSLYHIDGHHKLIRFELSMV